MTRSATFATIAAIMAMSGSVMPIGLSAQEYLNPRPMPRSSQAGADQLRALIDEAPGFVPQSGDTDTADATDMLRPERDLDDLVAPVALYPDNLLAQILVASTHPLDVVQADRLLADSAGLDDEEMSVLIAEQDWDPSVMVLMAGFPEIISLMAQDLDWTEDLGDAMLSQDRDVLAAVQRRRAEAYTAGNLVSNEAQQIDRRDGEIYIQPTDPERVYVPQYDPEQVFSTREAPPPVVAGRQNPLANPIVAGALAFGGALLVSELFGGDGDDDDKGNDWDGYWDRDRSIDWRERQVYARPDAGLGWHAERDRYWNRADGRWRPEAERDRNRIEARRDALRWLEQDNARREARLEEMRDRERAAKREAQRLEERERERLAKKQAERERERERQAKEQAERDRDQQAKKQAEREREGEAKKQAEREREREAKKQAEREREREAKKQAERERDQDAKKQAEREREREAKKQAEREQQAKKQAEREREREAAREDDRRRAEKAAKTEARQAQGDGARPKKDGGKGKPSKKKCPKDDKSCK